MRPLTPFSCPTVVTSVVAQGTHFHSWKSSPRGAPIRHWHYLEPLPMPQRVCVQYLLGALLTWLSQSAGSWLRMRCLCEEAMFLFVTSCIFSTSSSSGSTCFFLDSLSCVQDNIQSFTECLALCSVVLLGSLGKENNALAGSPLPETH